MKKTNEIKVEVVEENTSEKKTNIFSSAWKKTVGGVQKATKSIVEKNKENSIKKKLEKLRPLFPEQFKSEDFHLPNIIKIVDDAVRRDNALCEGAIGWLDTIDGVEILCLYDEWVDESGIQFIPVWKCDSVYYVDSFNRNRYIETTNIFARTNEEKIAELENIAYCLGAKCCSIEIVESSETTDKSKTKTSVQMKKVGAEFIGEAQNRSATLQDNKSTVEFGGHNEPKRPALKWFAYDDNINGLIEKRCGDITAIKTKVLELNGSYCTTMNVKTACTIDKLRGAKGDRTTEKQAIKEYSRKLIFQIEF